MTLMSYGDLQRWKDIFKEDCYQKWLTRASPSGLDENAVQHVVARNLKSVTDELALEKRKVSDLTGGGGTEGYYDVRA